MGVGPLANPAHAGRGAGPEAVAVEMKAEKRREAEKERDLGDLQAVKEAASQEVIKNN